MNDIVPVLLHTLFLALGFLSLIFLLMAIKRVSLNLSFAALWSSLITVIINYQIAGDEIIGDYFNVFNSLIYSTFLILFIASAIYTIYLLKTRLKSKHLLKLYDLVAALLVTGSLILMINLWINAVFIETRYKNTPIIQVSSTKSLPFCKHDTVFMKITRQAKVAFLCPNGFGIFPSKGIITPPPKFLLSQVPKPIRDELKTTNSAWN